MQDSYETCRATFNRVIMSVKLEMSGTVRVRTASSPHVSTKNSFYKLISVIQMFMRKFLWFSGIHEIFLPSNYFQTVVYVQVRSQSIRLKL